MLRKMIMPTLGLDMEGATIQKWLKAEGDQVAKDEPVVVVETDKATTEITATVSGVLRQIVQPEGAMVPVTEIVAFIETDEPGQVSEEISPQISPRKAASPPEPPAVATTPTPIDASIAGDALRASPAARRLARELGVELARVQGTGPAGRIQGEDVRRLADREPRSFAPPRAVQTPPPLLDTTVPEGGLPGRLVPLTRKRRLTAERMSLSARTVARLTINMDVDGTELIDLRGRLLPVYEERHGVRLSYNDLLVKAVAIALGHHPHLNARWTDRGIFLVEQVNVGVAVAVQDGLVVPVIRNAGGRSLAEISSELSSLVTKAREDRLSLPEITGGTFTITNLGMFGVGSFTPIVNPPETAILGIGQMAERPVGRSGQIVLRQTMTLSLSFDHRIVDGAPAAQFLQEVKHLIEQPQPLA